MSFRPMLAHAVFNVFLRFPMLLTLILISLTINIYYILLLATINIYYILLLASMFNSQAEEGIFFDISRTLLTSQRTDELELETFGGYISSGLLFIITITFLLVKI